MELVLKQNTPFQSKAFNSEGPDVSFEHFEILGLLGAGCQSFVWEAVDLRNYRHVALKVNRHHSDKALLVREANCLRRINAFGIPFCWDVLDNGKQVGVVMELIEGISLDRLIQSPFKLCSGHIVMWMQQLTRIVDFCHRRNILHGDLKPQNLLVDGDDRIWLTDFGLHRNVQGSSDIPGMGLIAGSPCYLPPELLAGEVSGLTIVGEVYTLGVILHELLTGRPPLSGS
ncbi:MAG: serine/threonine protein kinase, partial [Planctomycetaceae bacterium]|nr:serine/threonine protein kinase [Planctomycetaceae bacterium]